MLASRLEYSAMRKIASLVLTALSCSLVGAFAGPTKIVALPFTIVTPGNYQLVSGLAPAIAATAITINVNVPGAVVLDLNGFLLSPFAVGSKSVQLNDGIDVIAGQDVTIKNGIIGTLGFGFLASISVNPIGASYLSNLTIKNVKFGNASTWNLILNKVDSSVVKNCNFAGQNGIADNFSRTGNIFTDDLFEVPGVAFAIKTLNATLNCKPVKP